jgi:hypothetical protein
MGNDSTKSTLNSGMETSEPLKAFIKTLSFIGDTEVYICF